MEIEQITAYATRDGKIFATLSEAGAHQASIDFEEYYRYNCNELYAPVAGCVDVEDMVLWLLTHKTAILKFLTQQEVSDD